MKKIMLAIAVLTLIGPSCSNKEELNIQDNDVFLVAIDAAHGGNTEGAFSESGVAEKDAVLSMAYHIEENCNIDGVKVGLVRMVDENLTFEKRIGRINSMEADIVIILHTAASRDRTKRGITLYHEENDDQSIELCNIMQANLSNIEGFENVECKVANRLRELEDCMVPAISAQLGYISNDEDFSFLSSNQGRMAFSNAITESISEYYRMNVNSD